MLVNLSGLLLLSLIDYATSASNTRCVPMFEGGSLCFTKPDPLVSLSWSSALEWCKNIGATLPTPEGYHQHTIYGNVLDFLGLHTETLWLGANSTYDPSNWHWANGTSFTGTIENGNVAGKTHAYIVRNGTDVKFVATSPFDSYSYVCDSSFPEINCAVKPYSFWTGSSCLTKYASAVSSYDAWKTCGVKGLASVDNLDEFSRWIRDSKRFWIGLHSAWWTWYDFVAGTSREVIHNRFGNNLPNGTSSGECLASFRNDRFNRVEWMNLDCARSLPFVCQKFVNNATSTTTIPPAVTAPSSTARTSITSTTTTTATRTITTQRTSSTSRATTPTSVTTTAAIPTSTTKTTASFSTSTTTEPTSTSSAFMTPATSDVTVTSSEWTADVTSHQPNNSKSTPANHDLAIGFGIGGGLFLLVIVWLTVLTAFGYRTMREIDDSLRLLDNQETTSSSSYDDIEFRNEPWKAGSRVSPYPI